MLLSCYLASGILLVIRNLARENENQMVTKLDGGFGVNQGLERQYILWHNFLMIVFLKTSLYGNILIIPEIKWERKL
ncbi:MAG: hypothetical protein CSB28_00340 [Desulfobacterales bacterium]|nr:MAG: hypothetical protein CSB28_00340 [Desulfobacterales bacterium]